MFPFCVGTFLKVAKRLDLSALVAGEWFFRATGFRELLELEDLNETSARMTVVIK